jgi:hypothetical protein
VQPFLQWRSNKYYISRVCVCSLRYPAWNAHAPFCNMWPVWLYNSFHIISQTARFSKKTYWKQNVCFDFVCHFRLIHFSFQEELSEIWSNMYSTLLFMYSARYSCPTLRKLEFSRQNLEIYSNIIFNENPSSGSQVVPFGRTDGQTWQR